MGAGFLGEWAASLGLTSPVKPELGSALGSSCATLCDLVNVYAVLDRQGAEAPGRPGEAGARPRRAASLEDRIAPTDPWVPLSERLAGGYAEVRDGAGARRRAAGRLRAPAPHARGGHGGHRRAGGASSGKPAAGKTGTTNDSFDTWFLGFTARPGGRRLARLRPQRAAARPRRDRRPGRAPHLARLHAGGAARPAPARLPDPRGHRPSSASTRRPARRWSPSSRACSSPTWRAPSPSPGPRARPAPPRSTCTTCSRSSAR